MDLCANGSIGHYRLRDIELGDELTTFINGDERIPDSARAERIADWVFPKNLHFRSRGKPTARNSQFGPQSEIPAQIHHG